MKLLFSTVMGLELMVTLSASEPFDQFSQRRPTKA
jgi:hypothetical protein